jgi:hypothetical protein
MNLNQFRTELKAYYDYNVYYGTTVEGLTDERTIRTNIKEKTNRFFNAKLRLCLMRQLLLKWRWWF